MRISDWSSDVCSSDLSVAQPRRRPLEDAALNQYCGKQRHARSEQNKGKEIQRLERLYALAWGQSQQRDRAQAHQRQSQLKYEQALDIAMDQQNRRDHTGQRRSHMRNRSEEHTSELQSLMRTSYAALCL